MHEPVIRARGASFAFGPISVFRHLDLTVPRGSIYGLLGPNGCGKSTFLRLLIGQGRLDEGSLEVWGRDPVSRFLEIRGRTGFVPQENDLDPKLTVEQTLGLFASFYGSRWNAEVAEQRLERFGLELLGRRRVGSLSTGGRQRLSLVTALAIEPDLLLLDEPTGGLDTVVRRDFVETVIEYMSEDPKRTVVICSHLLSELEPLVDHVGMMLVQPAGSRMLVEASMRELKSKMRVAQLEGTDGTVLDHPELLCRSRVGSGIQIFWLEDPAGDPALNLFVREAGGEMLPHTGLDELFVDLFRSTSPVEGRRVIEGRLTHG
ncbi:MAG: ABC transporter ATP-binding protein [Holophagales bacterium]|nr:ABC transporter ATP-binding protein [Holophagales bacterium]